MGIRESVCEQQVLYSGSGSESPRIFSGTVQLYVFRCDIGIVYCLEFLSVHVRIIIYILSGIVKCRSRECYVEAIEFFLRSPETAFRRKVYAAVGVYGIGPETVSAVV